MAVAGYPEIDVATRPLDWPLHPKSIEALEVSAQLDCIPGIQEGTSLRSSILNRDVQARNEKDWPNTKVIKDVNRDCIVALFWSLRKYCASSSSNPQEDCFTASETQFLASLHSHDNQRRVHWWPRIDDIYDFNDNIDLKNKNIEKSSQFNRIEDIKNELEKRKNIGDGAVGDFYKSSDDGNILKKYDKLKKKQEESIHSLEKFCFPSDWEVITFQYHYVQTWLDSIRPTGFDGTNQRWIRGYSLLLELLTSEVLQIVGNKLGIGAVIIHGGGRVSFSCPNGKKGNIMKDIENAKQNFLHLNSFSSNNIRFNTSLEHWAKACFQSENPNKQSQDKPKNTDYEKWFHELKSFLPPSQSILKDEPKRLT